VAADFAIFNIGLAANGEVQDHRNHFATIRTVEGVFHETLTLSMVPAACRTYGMIRSS
jgi:hypothetical protein